MKKQFIIYALALCALMGCKDNCGLYGLLTDYDARITTLERLCSELNTNISSLQAIVEAQQTGDYITSITPIKENGVVIGYTITFAKNDPITIYHGQDGKDGKDGTNGINGTNGVDGHTPIIGVAEDIDGVYYWTLDGEWLLDNNGQKLRVTGKNGQNGQDGTNGTNGTNGIDGITPQLKIEADYWWISYDNGATWAKLDKAKGENGADGQNGQDGQNGDSMFQSVTQDENNVYFTLTDSTVITIAKSGKSNFDQAVKDNLVTTLTLTAPKDTILIGEQITLSAITIPFGDSKKVWTSSNTEVATITDSVVTGVSVGIINISVTSGDKTKSHKIYVKSPIEPYFSVSGTKNVQFSPGNLQYQISTNSWMFAPKQTTTLKKKPTEADIIDLFAYGSSGATILPTANGSNIYSDISGTNNDWGVYNIISGYPAGTWRTPTKNEWEYLLTKRQNAAIKNYPIYISSSLKGWVVYPDNWLQPIQVPSFSNNEYNKCSQSDLDILLLAGAVFLPEGGFWSSTYYPSWYAYHAKVFFGSSNNGVIYIINSGDGVNGGQIFCYVRLVKDVE